MPNETARPQLMMKNIVLLLFYFEISDDEGFCWMINCSFGLSCKRKCSSLVQVIIGTQSKDDSIMRSGEE
jgi:hypothetical protein